jgi:hypothetical protein
LIEEELPTNAAKDQAAFLNFIRMINDLEQNENSTDENSLKVMEVKTIEEYKYRLR